MQACQGGDLDDAESIEPREVEEGDVVAEGVIDVPGYGRSLAERATFIVSTIQDHLQRQACERHVAGVADLEFRLGHRPRWCPDCGVRLE